MLQPNIAPFIDHAPRFVLEPVPLGEGTLLKTWPGYLGSLAISTLLFAKGLTVPLKFRVRGDAYQYLETAGKFDSFWSALTYVGDRANGLPVFEYLLKQQDFVLWANEICISLFVFHFAACAWLTQTLAQKRWLAPGAFWKWFLFSLLVIYPPMVMHATAPLTDTFGASLLIFAVCLLARVNGESSVKDFTWASISGGLFGCDHKLHPLSDAHMDPMLRALPNHWRAKPNDL